MNVRITKIFGREIIIQDEELEMPEYLKIKGVVKEPSWLVLFYLNFALIEIILSSFHFLKRLNKNRHKIILFVFALMVLASIGVGILIGLKKEC